LPVVVELLSWAAGSVAHDYWTITEMSPIGTKDWERFMVCVRSSAKQSEIASNINKSRSNQSEMVPENYGLE
jgi:hypothetical protein